MVDMPLFHLWCIFFFLVCSHSCSFEAVFVVLSLNCHASGHFTHSCNPDAHNCVFVSVAMHSCGFHICLNPVIHNLAKHGRLTVVGGPNIVIVDWPVIFLSAIGVSVVVALCGVLFFVVLDGYSWLLSTTLPAPLSLSLASTLLSHVPYALSESLCAPSSLSSS